MAFFAIFLSYFPCHVKKKSEIFFHVFFFHINMDNVTFILFMITNTLIFNKCSTTSVNYVSSYCEAVYWFIFKFILVYV